MRVEKDDLRNENLQMRNTIRALEKREQMHSAMIEEFDLDSRIYVYQVTVKNMLGNLSTCNLLVRKKLSGVHFVSLEEDNGDEFEIELRKVVKLIKADVSECSIVYKTVFQRKVTVNFQSSAKRKDFFEDIVKSFKSAGIGEAEIKKII